MQLAGGGGDELWVGMSRGLDEMETQHLRESLANDGFSEVAGHTGFEAALAVLFEDVGGEGDNGRTRIGMSEFAQPARGLQAIHNGHLHVHENQVKGLILAQLNGLGTITGDDDGSAHSFEQEADDVLVGEVIFHH